MLASIIYEQYRIPRYEINPKLEKAFKTLGEWTIDKKLEQRQHCGEKFSSPQPLKSDAKSKADLDLDKIKHIRNWHLGH
jgi:hypothetical protein